MIADMFASPPSTHQSVKEPLKKHAVKACYLSLMENKRAVLLLEAQFSYSYFPFTEYASYSGFLKVDNQNEQWVTLF